jgi:hypothetical protein
LATKNPILIWANLSVNEAEKFFERCQLLLIQARANMLALAEAILIGHGGGGLSAIGRWFHGLWRFGFPKNRLLRKYALSVGRDSGPTLRLK